MHKSTTALGILALSIAPAIAAANAVEVEPGKRYEGGTRVQFASVGVSFVIPKGWIGAMAADGSGFLMGSNTERGALFATAEPHSSIEQIRTQLSQPLALDEMTMLMPTGKPEVKGSKVSARFSASAQGQEFGGYARATVLNGTAVGFIAMGPAKDKAKFEGLANQLLASLEGMSKEEIAKANKSSGAWAEQLRGKAVVYYKTGGGLSTKKKISLCADGTAVWGASDSYLSIGGASNFSGAGQSSDVGRWKIQGNVLSVRWNDGSSGTWTLSRQNGKTFLDNERWFVTNEANCR